MASTILHACAIGSCWSKNEMFHNVSLHYGLGRFVLMYYHIDVSSLPKVQPCLIIYCVFYQTIPMKQRKAKQVMILCSLQNICLHILLILITSQSLSIGCTRQRVSNNHFQLFGGQKLQ